MPAERHRLDELLETFRYRPADEIVFQEEDGRWFTAQEFDDLVAKTVAWFGQQGLQPGDRVAVWLVNRIEWLALLFAAARTGVILVAVNTRYRSAELHHILTASGARLLILQPHFLKIDFSSVIAALDPTEFSELTAVAILNPPPGPIAPILHRPTIGVDLDRVAAPTTPRSADTSSDPDAPLALFTTSGTTKSPKLVVHPQRTLAQHALRCAKACRFNEEGTAFLSAMPFCGVFGLNTLLAAIAGGATVYIISMFEAEDASRRIAAGKITHLFGSDEMFRRLVECGMERLVSARLCGFAAFTPGLGETMRAAMERGLPLAGLYGSSEVNAIFAVQPLDLPIEERLKGGGRLSSGSEAQVRVRDKETGELLGPNEMGELELRAPTSFIGYYRNPKATAEAVDAEGFFHSGDIGYSREDGTFVYVARSGDAIRLAGFLVDPVEIEDALKTVSGVRDAQVVGVPLEGKMRAVAFVIPTDLMLGIDEATVIAAAKDMLAAFKVPVRVFPVTVFPTTESANGLKIQKAKLRQMAAELLGAS